MVDGVSSTAKNSASLGAWKNSRLTKLDRLVHAADQLGRQAHEGDDLPDRGAVVQMQPGAEREDRDQRDGRAGARQHGQQRPPVEHRELRGDQLVHGVAQLAGLGGEPHEALHQHDVAERIARLLGERGVVGLDPGLGSMGVAEHGPGQARDHEDQQHDQGAQPPVQEQRERQQHEQGDEGREVLAQERQPHAEQRVGALPHDLQLAPRMRAAVEGVGQPQDVLEILAHRGQAAAVGEAVGVQRDQDAGADAGHADRAPCAEQQQDLLPGLVARARRCWRACRRCCRTAGGRGRRPRRAPRWPGPGDREGRRSGASRATTRRYSRRKLILRTDVPSRYRPRALPACRRRLASRARSQS